MKLTPCVYKQKNVKYECDNKKNIRITKVKVNKKKTGKHVWHFKQSHLLKTDPFRKA